MSHPNSYRLLLTATLTTCSELHIGDGEEHPLPGAKQKKDSILCKSVCVDSEGRPYLPGSALRGPLRQRIFDSISSDSKSHWEALLGKSDATLGGKLIFFNAFQEPKVESPSEQTSKQASPSDDPIPYFDPVRGTGVIASTAIERRTRTADPQKLYHLEYVPAGTSFTLRIGGDFLSEAEIDEFCQLLKELAAQDSADSVQFGALSSNNWGRLKWEIKSLHNLSDTQLIEKLQEGQSPKAGYGICQDWGEDIWPSAAQAEDPSRPQLLSQGEHLEFKFAIQMDSEWRAPHPAPLSEKSEVDSRPFKLPDGRLFIPTKSFRGALRAQTEKICRTPIKPDLEGEESSTHPEKQQIHPVEALFGNEDWQAPLTISPPTADKDVKTIKREHLAIDRFTHGTGGDEQGGHKFNAENAAPCQLSSSITVNMDRLRLRDPQLRSLELLAFALRDLAEGDLTLGAEGNRGLGSCHLDTDTSTVTEHRDGSQTQQTLSEWFDSLEKPHPADAGATGLVKTSSHALQGAPAKNQSLEGTPDQRTTGTTPPNPFNSLFHNPYHFVALGEKCPDTVSLREFAPPEADRAHPHITHDRYVENAHSGRLVCRVTVEIPTICGNEAEVRTDQTKLLKPSTAGGKPRLPASSLKGMLSAIAEAASNSSMRELNEQVLSYRKPMENALSAIGMVVQKGDNFYIYPLAEPHYSGMENQNEPIKGWRYEEFIPKDAYPRNQNRCYSRIFPYAKPKYYFGNTKSLQNHRYQKKYQTPSFATDTLTPFYGISREVINKLFKNGHQKNMGPKIKKMGGQYVLLGMRCDQNQILRWDDIDKADQSKYLRGVVHSLGVFTSRKGGMRNKKHDYFFPFQQTEQKQIKTFIDEQEADESVTKHFFPITANAVDRFHTLADERAKAANKEDTKAHDLLPYTPNGASRGERAHRSWQLKTGDIVFFLPSEDGWSIDEISLSSIWRGRVEDKAGVPHTIASFLPDPNLCPLDESRSELTLAEQLFGAVQKQKRNTKSTDPAFALAGRLRISDALPGVKKPKRGFWQFPEELWNKAQKDYAEDHEIDIPLLNLASPKPPSPNIYFTPRKREDEPAANYIRKDQLNPKDHKTQGRGFYLPRPGKAALDPESPHYVGGLNAFVHPDLLKDQKTLKQILKQHQSVEKFIRPESELWFSIDFDNLSDRELQLLTYSLRPKESFRHQIGHAKSRGFGQLKIDIMGLLTINRAQRYTKNGFAEPRYNGEVLAKASSTWPEHLRRFLPENETESAQKPGEIDKTLEALDKKFRKWAKDKKLTNVLQALETIRDPDMVKHPVHYPQVYRADLQPTHKDFHCKHFKWFGENDKASNQSLAPIEGSIPPLDRKQQPQ